MVRPEARRQAVRHVQKAFGLSERSACRALGVSRATQRYISTKEPQGELLARMRELAMKRPRAGYRTLYRLLRREGCAANHKRVYRRCRADRLSLRIKRRKKPAASNRVEPPAVMQRNDRWAMDFISETTSDGRRFRILTLIDTFTRRATRVKARGTGALIETLEAVIARLCTNA